MSGCHEPDNKSFICYLSEPKSDKCLCFYCLAKIIKLLESQVKALTEMYKELSIMCASNQDHYRIEHQYQRIPSQQDCIVKIEKLKLSRRIDDLEELIYEVKGKLRENNIN